MRKILFFLLLIQFSCYELKRDCKSFHLGEFKFSQIIGGKMKTSYFKRDSLYEIEIFENKTDTARINWVSDCECVLTKLNPKNYQEKRPIQIKILSTNENSYEFEYSLVGDLKNKRRGKIEKLK